jgi:putative ABC transport system permease protein
MTEFLGVPMTVVMWILVAMLALALASVAWVAVRHRILFVIGLRYVPRRRAQSTLIVLGLMLSTAIIAAALSTGDTVNYSITQETYDRLGHVDELVHVRDNQRDQGALNEEQIAPAGYVPASIVDEVGATLNGIEDADGFLPGLRFPAPATNGSKPEIKYPQLVVMGLDPRFMQGFENDVVTRQGVPFPVESLQRNQALINASAARELELRINDRVNVFIGRVPRTLTVVGIVQDKFLTGWTQGEPAGMVVNLDTAQFLFNTEAVGFIAVSNNGGVRDSLSSTDAVVAPLRESLGGGLGRFEVSEIKRDRVERAEEQGANMTAIFFALGLFTIAAGMLLVFLIMVMLAAERRSEMGMSRAVGMKRMQLIESFMAEGMAYSLTAAAVGLLLGGIVSLGMTRAVAYIFDAFDVAIAFHVTWRSIVIAYCLGVVLTYATVTLSAWRVSNLTVVTAIRDMPDLPRRGAGAAAGAFGGALVAVGIGLLVFGIAREQAVLFGIGASLAFIGAAVTLRAFALPERPVFTAMSLLVLVLWALIAGETLSGITGPLDAGIDTFFIGGVLMVAAATLVILYNADILLGSLRGVGILFARALPAVRTAIAYPLANKFRTGMTIAMMSLVVFALVMISTLSMNFKNLFLSDDSRGGWDVQLDESPSNAFLEDGGNAKGPLGEALDRALQPPYDTRAIDTISQLLMGNPRTTEIAQVAPGGGDLPSHEFQVVGADDTFLEQNEIGFQARAEGFDSDRAVWDAVRDDPNNAVIDGSVVPGINYANVTEGRFTLDGYESGTRSFTPFPIRIRDSVTGGVRPVRIIGIMNRGPSETYRGVYINTRAFENGIAALYARYYIRLNDGYDAKAEAQKMERSLAQEGARAHSIAEQVSEQQRLSSAFFYLVQGFMALGLGVGLAALGVIAFRTVVERRQQIGILRAIGFSRANITLSFMLESAFIALLGIINGVWLALLLAQRILQSDQFSTAGFTTFYVPWLQIAIVSVLVFIAAVLTTLIPSRQASSMPIAEAIRYE